MDTQILKLFESKKIFLKDLKNLDVSEFSRSKTLKIFFGVDLKGFYTIVFFRFAKSRLLKKESQALNELCTKFEAKFDTAIKKRILFYSSPACSKALDELTSSGWKCHEAL
ncbi:MULTISPECIES: hypothetical protein [unclassified Campylobacter]|uniref:hypothetical protein n=1 Tax=unclassified Campylobacter TaxID=2593542 RepID=UPI003D32C641